MKVGIAVGAAATAEWIDLTLAALPNVEVTIITPQNAATPVSYEFLIVDGDDPGHEFIRFYKTLTGLTKEFSMLVLGSANSPVLMAIDWDENKTRFLAKPYQLENLRETFTTMLRGPEKKKEEAPTAAVAGAPDATPKGKSQSLGYLSTLRLSDLLQMLCLNQWSGKILAQHLNADENGEMYIISGQIVSAKTNVRENEEACYDMLAWGRCEFSFIEDTTPVIATIHQAWESILMEGARRLDEAEAARSKTA